MNLQEWNANTLKPTDTVAILSNAPTKSSPAVEIKSIQSFPTVEISLVNSEKLLLKEMLAKNLNKFAAVIIVGNAPAEEYQSLVPGAIVVNSRDPEVSNLLNMLAHRESLVQFLYRLFALGSSCVDHFSPLVERTSLFIEILFLRTTQPTSSLVGFGRSSLSSFSGISLWLICQNATVSEQLTSGALDVSIDAVVFNPHTDGFKEVSKHQGSNPKTIHSIFKQLRQHQFIISATADNYRQRAARFREFYFIRAAESIEKVSTSSSSSIISAAPIAPTGVWNRKVIRHLDQIGKCAKDGIARLTRLIQLSKSNPDDRKDSYCNQVIVSGLIDFVARQSSINIDCRWRHLICPYNLRTSMREEVEKVNKLMHELSPLPTCLIVSTLDYHLEHFLS